jgi:steroid delta-isomerase-like uncharacterized protein
MSEQNVAIARAWFEEVWNQQDASAIFRMSDPAVVAHTSAGTIQGSDTWKAMFWDVFVRSFSGIKVNVERIVASGDDVVVHWHVKLTHTGAALGVPATRKELEASGMSWLVIRNGKIVEGRDCWDSTRLMRECGVA